MTRAPARDFVANLAIRAIRAGVRIPGEAQLGKFAESTYLVDLLDRLKIDCILDVGANIGQFGSRIRGMGYSGTIVSFEPIPTAFAKLSRQAAADSRWHCFNFALGSGPETKSFNVLGGEDTVYSSFLEPREGTPAAREEIEIEIRALDAVFPEIEALAGPDARYFLKLDTQGYDLEVCKGAAQVIRRMRGLLSELSVKPLYVGQPHYLEALAVYEALGFSLMNLAIVNRTPLGEVLEYDCVLARPEALPA